MVGRVVDDDPVAHVLVFSRLVGDWNGAKMRPEARLALRRRPHSFERLVEYECVVGESFDDARTVQCGLPLHANCWVPEVLAQLVTCYTLYSCYNIFYYSYSNRILQLYWFLLFNF